MFTFEVVIWSEGKARTYITTALSATHAYHEALNCDEYVDDVEVYPVYASTDAWDVL